MNQNLRLPLEEDMEIFRDSVRKFFDREIAPHREDWLEKGMVERTAFEKAGAQGLLLMWADEKYGGVGCTDFRYEQIIIEEQARIMESGLFLALHSRLVAPYFKHFGTEEQRMRFLPDFISGKKILGIGMTEPGAGSDLAGMKTHAVDQGDHWLLNGQKTYISNGILGDVFVVAAKTDPQQKHAMGLFIVERGMEGFERGRKLRKMGLHSQDTAELFFTDVRIAKENVLGDAHKGFYYMMQGLAEERLLSAVQSLSAAGQAYQLTLDYVKERKAFGKAVADFQNTRFVMAKMRAELDMGQAFVDRLVSMHNEQKLDAVLAAEGKMMLSELQGRVVDECVQLHGGAGYMEEYAICQLYTDARVTRIFAGSTEIMKEIISRDIFSK